MITPVGFQDLFRLHGANICLFIHTQIFKKIQIMLQTGCWFRTNDNAERLRAQGDIEYEIWKSEN
jgi:hypothetical protein